LNGIKIIACYDIVDTRSFILVVDNL